MKVTMPVRFLGEPWRVGHWSILTLDGDGYHCDVLYTPRRTEIEKGDILWVHAYLRSESARHARRDSRMYRYVEEPAPAPPVCDEQSTFEQLFQQSLAEMRRGDGCRAECHESHKLAPHRLHIPLSCKINKENAMPNDTIRAPWSRATVIALNQQQHGIRHAYTCPLHDLDAPALVATRGGWICSEAPDCEYTQDWAHLSDVRFLDELRESLETPARDTGAQSPAERPKALQPELSLDEIAEMAYEAYSQASGGKAFNGDPLPSWADVNPQIQSYWRAAMRVVRGPLSRPPRVGAETYTPPGD